MFRQVGNGQIYFEIPMDKKKKNIYLIIVFRSDINLINNCGFWKNYQNNITKQRTYKR